jgi:nucleoside phosphorylase
MRWMRYLHDCPEHVFAHAAVDAFRVLRSEGHAPSLDEYMSAIRDVCAGRSQDTTWRFEVLLAVSYELADGNLAFVSSVLEPELWLLRTEGAWRPKHAEALSHFGLTLSAPADAPANERRETLDKVITIENQRPRRSKVVILCALDEEFDAFDGFAHGSAIRPGVPATRRIRSLSDDESIMLLGIGEAGNVHSALAAQWAISEWRPGLIILAGIAGGIRSTVADFRLGDLIVPPQIVGYEYAKVKAGDVRRRLRVADVGQRAMGIARGIAETSDWATSIAVADPIAPDARPAVHFGALLSGEKVVADIDVVADLQRLWPSAIALEMEAAGIVVASYESGTAPDVLVAKAACDWADPSKGDDYHARASAVAASFAYELARRWIDGTLGATDPVRKRVRTDGLIQNTFDDRLDDRDAFRLAVAMGVHQRYKRTWPQGMAAAHLWTWLADRDRLSELADQLVSIERPDLALIFYEDDDSVIDALHNTS